MPVDLTPAREDTIFQFPADLTEETASLSIQGDYRVWRIYPRQGTATSDKWTILGTPMPNFGSNPAACYEDGQYPSLQDAFDAAILAETEDNGTHEEE